MAHFKSEPIRIKSGPGELVLIRGRSIGSQGLEKEEPMALSIAQKTYRLICPAGNSAGLLG